MPNADEGDSANSRRLGFGGNLPQVYQLVIWTVSSARAWLIMVYHCVQLTRSLLAIVREQYQVPELPGTMEPQRSRKLGIPI